MSQSTCRAYLGQHYSLQEKNQDKEIQRRIMAGWAHTPNTGISSKATHWTLTKQAQNKLAAAQTKMERSMLNITYKARRTNIWVRERTKLIDIIYTVRKMKWSWAGHINRLKDDRWTSRVTTWRPYDKKIRQKYVKGDQPSGGEKTWTSTGATRYGRGQHKTGSFGDDMLRPSPKHGTQRLPNDDDDVTYHAGGMSVFHSIHWHCNMFDCAFRWPKSQRSSDTRCLRFLP